MLHHLLPFVMHAPVYAPTLTSVELGLAAATLVATSVIGALLAGPRGREARVLLPGAVAFGAWASGVMAWGPGYCWAKPGPEWVTHEPALFALSLLVAAACAGATALADTRMERILAWSGLVLLAAVPTYWDYPVRLC